MKRDPQTGLPKPRRRIRPTFLLRLVVFGSLLAIGLLGMRFGPWLGAAGFGSLVLAFYALELGLDGLLARWLARRTAAGTRSRQSLWFVDLEFREAQFQQELRDDTEDNPTLR